MPNKLFQNNDTSQSGEPSSSPRFISIREYRAIAKRTVLINAGICFVGLAVALFVYSTCSLPAMIPRHDRGGHAIEPESVESFLFSLLIMQVAVGLMIPLWQWILSLRIQGSPDGTFLDILGNRQPIQLVQLVFLVFIIMTSIICLVSISRSITIALNLIS